MNVRIGAFFQIFEFIRSKFIMMSKFWKTVVLTGLFVGTTDIVMAFISQYVKTGKFAEKMFNYIAGGALGLETSMAGGPGVEFLGLLFHYFIAMSYTVLFFMILPKIKILQFNKYLVGVLYAAFVNLTMRYIVLSLTPIPGSPFVLSKSFIDWILLGMVLGIPIAFRAYKYYKIEGNH